jgi:DNA (cytosine-5)-methyltransferase 1
MRALRGAGYQVAARILNAANYGVPQLRRRVFIIGTRLDQPPPVHPEPEGTWITIDQALAGLDPQPDPKQFMKVGQRLYRLWHEIELGHSGNERRGKTDVKYFNWEKPNPRGLCPTIQCHQAIYHWTEIRTLSVREVKRLHSFPDDFVLAGNWRRQWKQIGNSVPPQLMRAVASAIRREVLEKSRPDAPGATTPPWSTRYQADEPLTPPASSGEALE